MEYSNAGMELTKEFEGCRLTAYRDSAGVLTIGYGRTIGVYTGMTITQNESDNFLAEDILWAVNAVNRLVRVSLTQGQFDALVDFVFNVGSGNFQSSTLLEYVNAGEMDKAADEFPLWVHAGGRISEGLARRREAEREMFLGQG